MTASSPVQGTSASINVADGNSKQQVTNKQYQHPTTSGNVQVSGQQVACPTLNSSSAAFQQIKQTQASLARLCRVHQQHQSQHHSPPRGNSGGQTNQSSQQTAKSSLDASQQLQEQQQAQQNKPTTFVDCLIRRFKNCFSEDFCTVPMFVVGNLSPGSDGTHLILPPCVSLASQNINRFSSPKNLRLINSIRGSCHSIEELDLGGNKLTDLIEVYKILQCMPNLRFLNLSENDLSRTSPVAMASSSYPSTAVGSTTTPTTTMAGQINVVVQQNHTGPTSRTCLAPINQNQLPSLGARRHSSLGQTTTAVISATQRSPLSSTGASSTLSSPMRLRQRADGVPRVAEVRRLAAANALAQSRKTSSTVANKLASSATNTTTGGSSRVNVVNTIGGSTQAIVDRELGASSLQNSTPGKKSAATRSVASQRLKATHPSSTMHLARSLSSLSAKDLRNATSCSSVSGRLNAHYRSSARNNAQLSTPTRHNQLTNIAAAAGRRSSIGSATAMRTSASSEPLSDVPPNMKPPATTTSHKDVETMASKIKTSTSHQKLFVEPIAETEDVDMNAEQHVNGTVSTTNSLSTATDQHQSSVSISQQNTVNRMASTTATTTTGNNTLRSFCSNNSLLSSVSTNTGNYNFRRTFESIKALALNNTGCQWKVVCSILSRMPNLEELHLSLNNYERIDLDVNEFKHHSLKRLYLCNNPKLTNWEELDKILIAFPSLEALSIANCNISQIPDNLSGAREWRKLCGLNINGWPIKEWPVIERLNQLPSLIDLKCRDLAVLNTIDEPRHHIIARLPKLKRLNGSEIEEREHAEKAFLRFFMVNSHLERPDRFHELMRVYGEVPQHVDVDVDLSPPSHAHIRVIHLNRNHYCKEDEDDVLMSEDFLLKLMDNMNSSSATNSSQENMDISETNALVQTDTSDSNRPSEPVRLFKDAGQEVVALEVDLRQSVRKFKTVIASLFGLDSQNLILYYIDHEMVGLMGPELIKHNQKKLWNYNVQDGDQFIVENR